MLSKADELMKLKELFDSGVLTQEEFEVEKSRLLSENDNAQSVPPKNTPPSAAPPNPPKKRGKGCVWVIAIFVIIGAIAVMVSTRPETNMNTPEAPTVAEKTPAADTEKPQQPEIPVEAPKPETPEETLLSAGDTVTFGNWETTMDAFEITDKIDNTYGSFTPDEGNKFVVVTLTVKNTGPSADNFLKSYPFGNKDVISKIIYQDKYEFSSTNLLGYKDDLHDEMLNPLTSLSGVIAFNVIEEAANSDELVFTLFLGNETVKYALK